MIISAIVAPNGYPSPTGGQHITLVYMGDSDDDAKVPAEYVAHLQKLCMTFTLGNVGPFQVPTLDVGELGDAQVLYLATGTQLEEIREVLVQDPVVSKLMAAVYQFPSFTPHMSLAYPSDGDAMVPDGLDTSEPITVVGISLGVGDNSYDFLFPQTEVTASLIAAAGQWDPHLHPRGKDGKFIEKFGIVKFLESLTGKWSYGQVVGMSEDSSKHTWVTVRPSDLNGAATGKPDIDLPPSKLYSAPASKAHLNLDAKGVQKIGGQGGSNPGGMYAIPPVQQANTNLVSWADLTKHDAAYDYSGHLATATNSAGVEYSGVLKYVKDDQAAAASVHLITDNGTDIQLDAKDKVSVGDLKGPPIPAWLSNQKLDPEAAKILAIALANNDFSIGSQAWVFNSPNGVRVYVRQPGAKMITGVDKDGLAETFSLPNYSENWSSAELGKATDKATADVLTNLQEKYGAPTFTYAPPPALKQDKPYGLKGYKVSKEANPVLIVGNPKPAAKGGTYGGTFFEYRTTGPGAGKWYSVAPGTGGGPNHYGITGYDTAVINDEFSGNKVVWDPATNTKTKLADWVPASPVVQAKPDNTPVKYYVKQAKTPSHGNNEALANALYEEAGVYVPEVDFNAADGNIYSKIVDGAMDMPERVSSGDKVWLDKVRANFAVDAWLGNRDVFGLTFDNVLTDNNGEPVRIDNGGALIYRAQGEPKTDFGSDVTELEAFRVGSKKKAIYGPDMAKELELDGAQRVLAISPERISELVAEHHMPKSLADKLIARRKYIADYYNLPLPETMQPSGTDHLTSAPLIDPLDQVKGGDLPRTWSEKIGDASLLLSIVESGDTLTTPKGTYVLPLDGKNAIDSIVAIHGNDPGPYQLKKKAAEDLPRPPHNLVIASTPASISTFLTYQWQRGDRVETGGALRNVVAVNYSTGALVLGAPNSDYKYKYNLYNMSFDQTLTFKRWDPEAASDTQPLPSTKKGLAAEAEAKIKADLVNPLPNKGPAAPSKVAAKPGDGIGTDKKQMPVGDGTNAVTGEVLISKKDGKQWVFVKPKGYSAVVYEYDPNDPNPTDPKLFMKTATTLVHPGMNTDPSLSPVAVDKPKSLNGVEAQVGLKVTAKDGKTGTITWVSPDGKSLLFKQDGDSKAIKKTTTAVTIEPGVVDNSGPQVVVAGTPSPGTPGLPGHTYGTADANNFQDLIHGWSQQDFQDNAVAISDLIPNQSLVYVIDGNNNMVIEKWANQPDSSMFHIMGGKVLFYGNLTDAESLTMTVSELPALHNSALAYNVKYMGHSLYGMTLNADGTFTGRDGYGTWYQVPADAQVNVRASQPPWSSLYTETPHNVQQLDTAALVATPAPDEYQTLHQLLQKGQLVKGAQVSLDGKVWYTVTEVVMDNPSYGYTGLANPDGTTESWGTHPSASAQWLLKPAPATEVVPAAPVQEAAPDEPGPTTVSTAPAFSLVATQDGTIYVKSGDALFSGRSPASVPADTPVAVITSWTGSDIAAPIEFHQLVQLASTNVFGIAVINNEHFSTYGVVTGPDFTPHILLHDAKGNWVDGTADMFVGNVGFKKASLANQPSVMFPPSSQNLIAAITQGKHWVSPADANPGGKLSSVTLLNTFGHDYQSAVDVFEADGVYLRRGPLNEVQQWSATDKKWDFTDLHNLPANAVKVIDGQGIAGPLGYTNGTLSGTVTPKYKNLSVYTLTYMDGSQHTAYKVGDSYHLMKPDGSMSSLSVSDMLLKKDGVTLVHNPWQAEKPAQPQPKAGEFIPEGWTSGVPIPEKGKIVQFTMADGTLGFAVKTNATDTNWTVYGAEKYLPKLLPDAAVDFALNAGSDLYKAKVLTDNTGSPDGGAPSVDTPSVPQKPLVVGTTSFAPGSLAYHTSNGITWVQTGPNNWESFYDSGEPAGISLPNKDFHVVILMAPKDKQGEPFAKLISGNPDNEATFDTSHDFSFPETVPGQAKLIDGTALSPEAVKHFSELTSAHPIPANSVVLVNKTAPEKSSLFVTTPDGTHWNYSYTGADPSVVSQSVWDGNVATHPQVVQVDLNTFGGMPSAQPVYTSLKEVPSEDIVFPATGQVKYKDGTTVHAALLDLLHARTAEHPLTPGTKVYGNTDPTMSTSVFYTTDPSGQHWAYFSMIPGYPQPITDEVFAGLLANHADLVKEIDLGSVSNEAPDMVTTPTLPNHVLAYDWHIPENPTGTPSLMSGEYISPSIVKEMASKTAKYPIPAGSRVYYHKSTGMLWVQDTHGNWAMWGSKAATAGPTPLGSVDINTLVTSGVVAEINPKSFGTPATVANAVPEGMAFLDTNSYTPLNSHYDIKAGDYVYHAPSGVIVHVATDAENGKVTYDKEWDSEDKEWVDFTQIGDGSFPPWYLPPADTLSVLHTQEHVAPSSVPAVTTPDAPVPASVLDPSAYQTLHNPEDLKPGDYIYNPVNNKVYHVSSNSGTHIGIDKDMTLDTPSPAWEDVTSYNVEWPYGVFSGEQKMLPGQVEAPSAPAPTGPTYFLKDSAYQPLTSFADIKPGDYILSTAFGAKTYLHVVSNDGQTLQLDKSYDSLAVVPKWLTYGTPLKWNLNSKFMQKAMPTISVLHNGTEDPNAPSVNVPSTPGGKVDFKNLDAYEPFTGTLQAGDYIHSEGDNGWITHISSVDGSKAYMDKMWNPTEKTWQVLSHPLAVNSDLTGGDAKNIKVLHNGYEPETVPDVPAAPVAIPPKPFDDFSAYEPLASANHIKTGDYVHMPNGMVVHVSSSDGAGNITIDKRWENGAWTYKNNEPWSPYTSDTLGAGFTVLHNGTDETPIGTPTYFAETDKYLPISTAADVQEGDYLLNANTGNIFHVSGFASNGNPTVDKVWSPQDKAWADYSTNIIINSGTAATWTTLHNGTEVAPFGGIDPTDLTKYTPIADLSSVKPGDILHVDGVLVHVTQVDDTKVYYDKTMLATEGSQWDAHTNPGMPWTPVFSPQINMMVLHTSPDTTPEEQPTGTKLPADALKPVFVNGEALPSDQVQELVALTQTYPIPDDAVKVYARTNGTGHTLYYVAKDGTAWRISDALKPGITPFDNAGDKNFDLFAQQQLSEMDMSSWKSPAQTVSNLPDGNTGFSFPMNQTIKYTDGGYAFGVAAQHLVAATAKKPIPAGSVVMQNPKNGDFFVKAPDGTYWQYLNLSGFDPEQFTAQGWENGVVPNKDLKQVDMPPEASGAKPQVAGKFFDGSMLTNEQTANIHALAQKYNFSGDTSVWATKMGNASVVYVQLPDGSHKRASLHGTAMTDVAPDFFQTMLNSGDMFEVNMSTVTPPSVPSAPAATAQDFHFPHNPPLYTKYVDGMKIPQNAAENMAALTDGYAIPAGTKVYGSKYSLLKYLYLKTPDGKILQLSLGPDGKPVAVEYPAAAESISNGTLSEVNLSSFGIGLGTVIPPAAPGTVTLPQTYSFPSKPTSGAKFTDGSTILGSDMQKLAKVSAANPIPVGSEVYVRDHTAWLYIKTPEGTWMRLTAGGSKSVLDSNVAEDYAASGEFKQVNLDSFGFAFAAKAKVKGLGSTTTPSQVNYLDTSSYQPVTSYADIKPGDWVYHPESGWIMHITGVNGPDSVSYDKLWLVTQQKWSPSVTHVTTWLHPSDVAPGLAVLHNGTDSPLPQVPQVPQVTDAQAEDPSNYSPVTALSDIKVGDYVKTPAGTVLHVTAVNNDGLVYDLKTATQGWTKNNGPWKPDSPDQITLFQVFHPAANPLTDPHTLTSWQPYDGVHALKPGDYVLSTGGYTPDSVLHVSAVNGSDVIFDKLWSKGSSGWTDYASPLHWDTSQKWAMDAISGTSVIHHNGNDPLATPQADTKGYLDKSTYVPVHGWDDIKPGDWVMNPNSGYSLHIVANTVPTGGSLTYDKVWNTDVVGMQAVDITGGPMNWAPADVTGLSVHHPGAGPVAAQTVQGVPEDFKNAAAYQPLSSTADLKPGDYVNLGNDLISHISAVKDGQAFYDKSFDLNEPDAGWDVQPTPTVFMPWKGAHLSVLHNGTEPSVMYTEESAYTPFGGLDELKPGDYVKLSNGMVLHISAVTESGVFYDKSTELGSGEGFYMYNGPVPWNPSPNTILNSKVLHNGMEVTPEAANSSNEVAIPGVTVADAAAKAAWGGDLTKSGHVPYPGMEVFGIKGLQGKIVSISKDKTKAVVLTADGAKTTRQISALKSNTTANYAAHLGPVAKVEIPEGMTIAADPPKTVFEKIFAMPKALGGIVNGHKGIRNGQVLVRGAKGPSGTKYARVYFTLTTQQRQALLEQLQTEKTPEAPQLGAWVPQGAKTIANLVPGDAVPLRNSSSQGEWVIDKNATAATHKMVSVDASGVYTFESLSTGEKITTPFTKKMSGSGVEFTAKVSTWDPTAPAPVVPKSGGYTNSLSAAAKAKGWTPASDAVISGFQSDGETLKIEPGNVVSSSYGTFPYGVGDGGFRMKQADGTVIEITTLQPGHNSMYGTVAISIPEGGDPVASYGAALDNLGLSHVQLTQESLKEQVRPILKNLVELHIANIDNTLKYDDGLPMSDAEIWKKVAAATGIPDVGWQDVRVGQTKSIGKTTFYWSDRVIAALTAKNSWNVVMRGGDTSNPEVIASVAKTGSIDALARKLLGYGGQGISPGSDVTVNAGHGNFFSGAKLHDFPYANGVGMGGGTYMVYQHPSSLLSKIQDYRTGHGGEDCYGTGGNHTGGASFNDSYKSNSLAYAAGGGSSSGDLWVGTGMGTEDIGYIGINDAAMYKKVMAILAAQGVTEIAGRPVTDVIQLIKDLNATVGSPSKMPPWTPPPGLVNFNDLPTA